MSHAYDMCLLELLAMVTRFLKVSRQPYKLSLQNKVTAFSYYVHFIIALQPILFIAISQLSITFITKKKIHKISP